MKIEVIDLKKKQILYTADILWGLDTLVVKSSIGISESNLEHFIEARLSNFTSYQDDEIVLERLGLINRKNLFGRMSEAKVLFALLDNFKTDSDDIAIYPLKDELISMIMLDSRYSNIYLWRTYENNDIDVPK